MPTLEEAFRIAVEHHHAGRLAEAEATYESILAAVPDQPEAMSNLGYAQQMQGKLAAAAATYRKVLTKWPDRLQPHIRLGEMMQWTGRWGTAVDCYETALSLAPKDEGLAAQFDNAVSLAARHQALREPLRRGGRLDLRDVTFMVPCRIESPDRKRNLRILVTYLRRHLDTNILVCEDNPERQDVPGIMAELGLSPAEYGYIHLTGNDSPYTHKAKQINVMAAAATTPVLVVQDTDVLVEPTQYVLAQQAVHGGAALACPFNGLFFDIGPDFVPGVERTLAVNQIDLFDPRNEMLYKNSYGGSVFFARRVFDRLGGFNEAFVSWGWEDFEIFRRLEILGERVERTLGPLLHLSHARSTNSVIENPWYAHNTAEYERIVSMAPDRIRAEIAAGGFRRPLVGARTVPGWVEPPAP
ncbi:tetratricopeptide (TPR) repeat protein [Azospirillum lipoferum]|uniref:Tetratricopeptide repeat protein n=1 Tax=Azospirillum lipoferum TaxID=193 RepID=A0A5A9GH92_AZOLI|nr:MULTISPECIES: glycosyltransferase family 2 protein [Azospirillum]KAA0593723.1 tetratricopeptide repeat protein [Azospirillum lipoferum]MCP1615014.1 tetratricopeptide (TPR) repeat protein [Azospirillum lipoferum]MDW5536919.1 galactosyltransferase-related protein [Azospirillum sp. NL1]